MDLTPMQEILESALRRGGEVLMEHYGKTGSATIKESISSVVTEADLVSEKEVIRVLDSAPNRCNIISEEAGYLNRNSGYTWVVDPLDGTSNFAAGLPWFGVIITLFDGREPVMGGMFLPVDDLLYFAKKGEGAMRSKRQIQTTSSTRLEEQLISYSFDFSDDPGKTLGEMALLRRLSTKVRNTRSTNSLIDLCYTADGRFGGMINQTTKIWDIAGAGLIIMEAGGIVTDISGKKIDFDLSAGSIQRNYTIVAAGRNLHGPLIKIVSDLNRSSA